MKFTQTLYSNYGAVDRFLLIQQHFSLVYSSQQENRTKTPLDISCRRLSHAKTHEFSTPSFEFTDKSHRLTFATGLNIQSAFRNGQKCPAVTGG